MAQVMQPQARQIRFVADALPLVGDVGDGPRRWATREEVRTVLAVTRDRVDDRARGA